MEYLSILVIIALIYILFAGRKGRSADLIFEIDNQNISPVFKTKCLGVVVDSKLSWKKHISYIAGNNARGIGVITQARRYLNKDSSLSLNYLFIYPYLVYHHHVREAAAKRTQGLCTLKDWAVTIISTV